MSGHWRKQEYSESCWPQYGEGHRDTAVISSANKETALTRGTMPASCARGKPIEDNVCSSACGQPLDRERLITTTTTTTTLTHNRPTSRRKRSCVCCSQQTPYRGIAPSTNGDGSRRQATREAVDGRRFGSFFVKVVPSGNCSSVV